MIQFKNIRTELLVILGGLIALVIALMGFVHYSSVKRALIDDYRDKHIITSLQASQSSLQSILERAIETSELLAEDPTLITWFENGEKKDFTGNLALHRLDYLHKSYKYTTVFAVSNSTYNYWSENFGLLDIISPDDPDDSWFFDAMKNKTKQSLNFDYNRELKRAVLFVNVLMGDKDKPLGVAGVGVDPSILNRNFEKHRLTPNSEVWLIDSVGEINMAEEISDYNKPLTHFLPKQIVEQVLNDTTKHLIADQLVKGQKVEIAYMDVGNTGYKVVMAVPLHELLQSTKVIRNNTLWLSLFFIILTLIVVRLLSRSVSIPLRRLTFVAANFANNKMDDSIDHKLLNRHDEIGTLANAFETMKNRLAKVLQHINLANEDLKNEKRQLEKVNKELNIALEKASESDRLTRSFLANISHEIRTPMNSILGFAQLLEIPDVLEKDRVLYATRVVKGGQQLLSILDNVINLSKIDSGIIQPHWSPVNIKQFMYDTFELFEPLAEKAGLKFKLKETNDYPDLTVVSDSVLMHQVINNLVNNAIKYTPKGTISLGYSVQDKFLYLTVQDTGPGIPMSYSKIIFEPFRQIGDSIANHGGAGLGLAISQKIAVILKGEIGLESSSPKGSTFYFKIPL